MSGLSKMIADFFVRENVIEHEEYEIYKYGSDILLEGKDGKKKLCSYYADKRLSCSDSLCANGVSRAEWHRAPESDGGVAKQELTEFDTDDVEKIPDHLTCQVDDLLMVDADVRLWGLSEWKLSDWYATEKNYTESEEEAHELIQKMMNEAGWKYEEKDVECYRNSEGEKIYYVEISNHEDNVYVLPDRFSYSTERGYVSLNQSDFCGDYKGDNRELYKTGRELAFGSIKESEQLAVDYAEKMGIQVSDTVDCYTLDEKNKRISWLDLDKFDNHTPEEEENRNFSYAIFLYQDYFGIPGLRYDPGMENLQTIPLSVQACVK